MKYVLSFPRCLRHLFQREDGQAAFEFLLVLPLFIAFVLLTVDFGVMMYEYVSVSNAAREGARYGAVNCGTGTCSDAAIIGRTVCRSGGILGASPTPDAGTTVSVARFDVNGSSADGSTGRGDAIQVSIDHPYTFLFFPATIHVTSNAEMRLEQQDGGGTAPAPAC